MNAAGAVRADQNVGCALASVPGGERDPPAHLVLRAGKHGEMAATSAACESVAAQIAPGDMDALARNCPDLRADAGRVTDVALDGAGDELALGGAGTDEDFR